MATMVWWEKLKCAATSIASKILSLSLESLIEPLKRFSLLAIALHVNYCNINEQLPTRSSPLKKQEIYGQT